MNSSCRWLANKNQYAEFSVPRLLLANAFMLGFDSVPRTPEQGVADIQGLKDVT